MSHNVLNLQTKEAYTGSTTTPRVLIYITNTQNRRGGSKRAQNGSSKTSFPDRARLRRGKGTAAQFHEACLP